MQDDVFGEDSDVVGGEFADNPEAALAMAEASDDELSSEEEVADENIVGKLLEFVKREQIKKLAAKTPYARKALKAFSQYEEEKNRFQEQKGLQVKISI